MAETYSAAGRHVLQWVTTVLVVLALALALTVVRHDEQ